MNKKRCESFRNNIYSLASDGPLLSFDIRETVSHLTFCDECLRLYRELKNQSNYQAAHDGGIIDLFTNRTEELEFLPQLEMALADCDSAVFNVAFIMRSGLELLKKHIRRVVDRGCRVDVITGTYMGATQPAALSELLLEFGDDKNVRLRCYRNELGAFHPKVYYFKRKDSNSVIFIGSSNLTYTALKTGIEWNCRIAAGTNAVLFAKVEAELGELLSNQRSEPVTPDFIRRYELTWKPNTIHVTERSERRSKIRGPNPSQAIALLQLKDTRDEGYKKALVIAATGVGKTFLAAMDSVSFKKILFIAHVEEILDQAARTFAEIHTGKSIGKYCGAKKEAGRDIVFASIQSISKTNNLKAHFSSGQFDYIVVDEFHHAAAPSYKTVIDFFEPSFLLGLTATPDRMDNRDIYSLCDYNIAYEVNLKKAIESQWLAPFTYHAIYDETVDYNSIKYANGKYDEAELEKTYISSGAARHRADIIRDKYLQYRHDEKTLTVAFCSSIKHANYMAESFLKHGIAAVPLHSKIADFFKDDHIADLCKRWTGARNYDRTEAIRAFESRKIKVLFVVDIFNEGVDIPHIEMELFLRPTESFTIFLQQLGRGLRLCEGKKNLVVLDFIGNYKKANFKPLFLSGQSLRDFDGKLRAVEYIKTQGWLPDNCFADFDFRVIDVFREMEKVKTPIEIDMLNTYREIALDHRPTMTEFFNASTFSHSILKSKFGGWLDFIGQAHQLNEDEKKIVEMKSFKDFFSVIEKTSMTKSYKIPVIYSFLDDDSIKGSRTISEIASYFKIFYISNKVFLRDIGGAGANSAIKNIDDIKQVAAICERMPIKSLTCGAEADYFEYDKSQKVMKLKIPELQNIGKAGVDLIKELLNFRINDYFKRRFCE